MKSIRCILGFHDWHSHIQPNGDWVRGCPRCDKVQHRKFDQVCFFDFAEDWTYSVWLKYVKAKTDHEKLEALTSPAKTVRAIHQDVSRFMKHGRQTHQYRKSVKAKVKPEEDD